MYIAKFPGKFTWEVVCVIVPGGPWRVYHQNHDKHQRCFQGFSWLRNNVGSIHLIKLLTYINHL